MLHKTKGIVIKSTPFRESSLVSKIFTEKFGLQTYIINGVRSSGKTGKAALFQPLTILELVVYKHEQKKMERISEVKLSHHFSQLHFDVAKSTAAFFIAELLNKIIYEEENNDIFFEWLADKLIELDKTETLNASFHLDFMLQISKHFGFYPHENSSETTLYFDLMNGVFQNEIPSHLNYLNKNDSKLFSGFLMDNNSPQNRMQRKKVLQILCDYFALHIPNFGKMKSPDVLAAMFD
jgi:DNA repair protein RecO (recombination protein O)